MFNILQYVRGQSRKQKYCWYISVGAYFHRCFTIRRLSPSPPWCQPTSSAAWWRPLFAYSWPWQCAGAERRKNAGAASCQATARGEALASPCPATHRPRPPPATSTPLLSPASRRTASSSPSGGSAETPASLESSAARALMASSTRILVTTARASWSHPMQVTSAAEAVVVGEITT